MSWGTLLPNVPFHSAGGEQRFSAQAARRHSPRPRSPSHAQVVAPEVLVLEEVAADALEDDLAVFHYVALVGDL